MQFCRASDLQRHGDDVGDPIALTAELTRWGNMFSDAKSRMVSLAWVSLLAVAAYIIATLPW